MIPGSFSHKAAKAQRKATDLINMGKVSSFSSQSILGVTEGLFLIHFVVASDIKEMDDVIV
jgi:hypothetical protein